ncbi:hypothetical protein A8B98_23050 [Hymenobacter sp. UV11]|nr:hypothetical protein A8B98_23050 [Hymenobacter sp. UV11]
MDKHNFWDSNFYKHPALTTDAVNEAEKLLGVRLPSEFIELLNVQNGGYTKGFAYPTTQPTSWAEDHVSLSELFGIVAESFDTAQSILLTAYMTEEWGLPEKQVLLCGDGHWWITLDYRKGEVPTVSWIDTEVEQDIHIADSFAAFLNGLVSDDAFAE